MNRKAFSHFLGEHLDGAYRFAYAYTKDGQDAQDVVSESVVKALKALPGLRSDAAAKSWFYTIIINTANSLFRLKARTLSFDFGEEAADGLLPASYDDYSHIDFYDMIQSLSAEKRIVIVLRFYEDYQIGEIAKILGMNENTVKKRLYSALDTLKKEWGGGSR